jgi:hypothetical protein
MKSNKYTNAELIAGLIPTLSHLEIVTLRDFMLKRMIELQLDEEKKLKQVKRD